jgi:hypothetical protein
MNTRRSTANACRALMMAGGVGIFLSGCQQVFWWRQKPEAVAVAHRSSSPRPPELIPPLGPQLTPQPEPRPAPDPAPEPRPLPIAKKLTYPVALAVPGREGMVLSPFNQRLVSVAGFKSGSLVADPHYPLSDKKFFRVP